VVEDLTVDLLVHPGSCHGKRSLWKLSGV